MNLSELKIKSSALVTAVGGEGSLRQHLLDMGVIPGEKITVVKYAPMGDPIQIRIHGYELTLRLDDAKKISVEPIKNDDISEKTVAKLKKTEIFHPGFGEGGKYHDKSSEPTQLKEKDLNFALAGNQNSGKTTLFNKLTGSNRHVGNFPGVTVERKSGVVRDHPEAQVTDLPGIYSLSPYSSDEIVSRQFILDEKPDAIINVADATNIERNLYLTLQLMELGVPVVLALNMMDEVRNSGTHIDVNQMEQMLSVPVVPIAAAKNEGVEELVRHAIHVAKYRECPENTDFCLKDENGGAVHRCLHGVMHLIEDKAEKADIPLRFAASKIVEGDNLVYEKLDLSDDEKEMIELIVAQMERERGLDRSAAMADMRFTFIEKLCAQTVSKKEENSQSARSGKIDRILTGRFTAIPSFIAIMASVFLLTFSVIGPFLQDVLSVLIDNFTQFTDKLLASMNVNHLVRSLIMDGIFAGVGSVLDFVPVIVVLFFFLSLLEDSGYMARIAFVTDKLLRKVGLSGRSIVPMLVGFGCTVPAVMASRTLPSERDRKMTVMLTPFMSCTAKLPIYVFFTAAFFPKHSGLIMAGLYVLGIAVAALVSVISKNTAFKGDPVPFVMELPNYRMPTAGNVLRLLWDKAKDFIKRAFTVIFIASIVVWFLKTFDFRLNVAEDASKSILATVAGFIAPIFKLHGFADYRVVTALIAGFMAKESVVSTLSVLIGTAGTVTSIISPESAAALLVFCLLYTPCVAAIASIRRELTAKWAWGIVIGQCCIAWAISLIVRAVLLVF